MTAGAICLCEEVWMPSSFNGLLDTWVDAWAATAAGVTDCVRTGTRIAPWPLDLGRWTTVANARRPPGWSSPHEIVFEAPLARLRDFSAGPGRGVVPTLVLPPQAGHDSCIVDYSAEQSQMRTIVHAGLTRAFTLDWAAATGETADASIEDYLDVIDSAVDHCGGRVNLIGDCQGGWLATIYAALEPQRINTLTIAGAPIDFHAGDPVIGEVIRWLAPNGDLRFYEALVASGGGVLKGRHMLSGFIMIQPGAEISRQLELLCNLGDAQHVARYKEFEDWFKHTQDIPGAFYLWVVRNLFRDNALIAGKLEVRGSRVKLGSLKVPLNLLAGASDHITPPAQVFALADHAGTAADDIQRRISSGGHLGLFMGREALAEHWPPLLAQVADHSRTSTFPRSSPARR
jgi:poly(3-hydroxybutyrate) depolymerase